MEPPEQDQPTEPRFEPAPSLGRVAVFAFGGVLLAALFFVAVVIVMLHA